MTIYLTKEEIKRLSEGRFIKCENKVFRSSKAVKEICKRMLEYNTLLDIYTPVLEGNACMYNIYLKKVRRRRKVS